MSISDLENYGEGDSYPDWNRRLHNIRDGLASTENIQRSPSVPLDNTKNLKTATAESMSSSQEQNIPMSASKGLETGALTMPSVPSHDPSTSIAGISSNQDCSPLAVEIYAHLVADLRTRPGSYIGKHVDDIASALQKSSTDVLAAIEELAVLRKVHNTIDGSTWVISRAPSSLPPLQQQQKPNIIPASSATDKTDMAMSMTAAQVLSYMKFGSLTPENENGHDIREIESALQKPTADIWPAIRELSERGDIRRSLNADTWVVVAKVRQRSASWYQKFAEGKEMNPKEPQEPGALAEIRETPTFQDTPPSPIEQPQENLPVPPKSSELMPNSNVDLSTVQAADFSSDPSPPGTRWTRINKDLVDAQVLTEVGETFTETEDSLMVHRVLRRGELERWTEKTNALRTSRERRSRRMSDHRRSDDRERGRRENKARDSEQERLERVLAGDMKEDSRHFGDEDDERRVDDIR